MSRVGHLGRGSKQEVMYPGNPSGKPFRGEDNSQSEINLLELSLHNIVERTTPDVEWITRGFTPARLPLVNECKQKHKLQLEAFQNKATRFARKIKGRDTSISTIWEELSLKTLAYRRKETCLSLLLHILADDNLFPTLIASYEAMLPNNTHHTTRSCTTNTPLDVYSRTNVFQHSFLIRTTR